MFSGEGNPLLASRRTGEASAKTATTTAMAGEGAWRWRTEEGEERGGDRGEFHCDIEHLVTRFPWWRDGGNGASPETAKTVAAAPVMVMIPTMTQHLEVVCEVTRKKGRWL